MRTLIGIAVSVLVVFLAAIVGFAIIGYWTSATAVFLVLGLIAGLIVIWALRSIGTIGPNEVGLKKWWGDLEKKIFTSGLTGVPWSFGIKFDGNPLCQLVRITKTWIKVRFNASFDDGLWTKPVSVGGSVLKVSQRVTADISIDVRLPFKEEDSLGKVVKFGVPMEPVAFKDWCKEEVITGVRDVVAQYEHTELIAHSKVSAVRKDVAKFLLRPDGLFAKSGICGNDAKNLEEGTGEVIVRLETIHLPDLEAVIGEPVVAGYRAEAAKQEKARQAEIAAVVPETYSAWLQTEEGKKATSAEKEKMLEIIRQRTLSQDGNYSEQALDVRGLDGIQYLSVGGGVGAGILLGGKGGKSGGKGQPRKNVEDLTAEELDAIRARRKSE